MLALLAISLILFIILGVPVAISIGFSSLLVLITNDIPLVLLPQRMFAGADSFPLVAIPFFILAGNLLAKGNVSKRLVDFADSLLGFVKGGLSAVAILGSMFFAAISGSAAATTAAIGAPLIPEMENKGYEKVFASALIAASGTIGIIIPPSVPMILYAIIADQSVARLFINGFLPGILMAAALMIIAVYRANKKDYPRGSKFDLRNIWARFKESFWGLLTPVIILGGIFSGYFTPSEAAVIAVDYAVFVALFIYKDLKWKDIIKIVIDSGVTMSLIMLLIATSKVFSWVLANWQLPKIIASSVLGLTENTFLILLFINIIILIAGIFMETASALIILTPVFLPIVSSLGINLIHFGLIEIIGLSIGMITPPVAINIYVASSVSNLSMEKISRAILPMIAAMVITLMAVTYIPLMFY